MLTRRTFLERSACALLLTGNATAHFDHPLVPKTREAARGRFESRASRSKRKDSELARLVFLADPGRLRNTVAALSAISTRWSGSPQVALARDWIAQALLESSYPASRVSQAAFVAPNGLLLHNVLCAPEQPQDGFILICAHYDSISQRPATLAPGADDNASGIAVMLEVARIMASERIRKGVMYAAFSGEEQGLWGSEVLAEQARSGRWPIDVVINMDMVGWVDPARPTNIVIEYDQGNRQPTNDSASKAFALQMAQLATDYTSLSVEHTDIWSSDYMPFEARGFPCVGIYDGGADASYYHTVNDLPQVVSIDRLVQVTRLLLAFVAQSSGLGG